jgi:membrane protein YdbS with pleckstrin-like domain
MTDSPSKVASDAQADGMTTSDFDPLQIGRPDAKLLTYYLLVSLLTGPGIIIAIWPLLFKYITLQYKFDASGVSMRWGVLFRTEIYLTYRRVQDIHLTRNLLQRWLGLATVSIQTASGSAAPEMKIEGILEVEALRDYLYSEMRGAKQGGRANAVEGAAGPNSGASSSDETLELLTEIRDQLRRIAGDEIAGDEIAAETVGEQNGGESASPNEEDAR